MYGTVGPSGVHLLFLGMILQGFRRIKRRRTVIRCTLFHPLDGLYTRSSKTWGVSEWPGQLGKGSISTLSWEVWLT